MLEMTESVLMDHTEENLAYFTAFKEMGVRLAIDDFGTGFSSLSYLHRFPVDVLKIDRSFVEALGDSPTDRALVTTIVQLGRTLNMRTVAEGIETEIAGAALVEMGCEHGQGFYFSPARPGRPARAAARRRNGRSRACQDASATASSCAGGGVI